MLQVVNNCKQKEEYREYFESFNVKIDQSHIETKIGELLIVVQKLANEQDKLDELNQLSSQLGIEERLNEIENEIMDQYPESNKNRLLNSEVAAKRKELALKNKVDSIFGKFPYFNQKAVNNIDLSGNHASKQLPIKTKKIIMKGQELPDSKVLETLGASGEEEVLLYFINEFIAIRDIEHRKMAIGQVYELLKKRIGDNSHKIYEEECLKAVKDNKALQKALIPFFYVTMHHKFSYFDLVAYYDGEPTLVEVKTTKKSNSFYISIAEVEAARGEDKYILIRNSVDCIYILGNPIKDIEKDISFIQGDKFLLKPRNYQFVLRNN